MSLDGSLTHGLLSNLESRIHSVTFLLQIEGIEAVWGVRSVVLREELSKPFLSVVEAFAEDTGPDTDALLGKSFSLLLRAQGETRLIQGIVRQASVSSHRGVAVYTLHLVPSIWRLTLGMDTRTYDKTTIPDLIKLVVKERLGEGTVSVDVAQLSRTYEEHEFLIQYQESAFNFISRWMEQEGIFFYLSGTEGQETMVLLDSTANLPPASPRTGGLVVHQGPRALPGTEMVSRLQRTKELGVTSVAVADFDWTNPALAVKGKGELPSELTPPAEVYDHADAVTYHRYRGLQYLHNSAEQTAKMRTEVLHTQRQFWSLQSTSVSAQPGHMLTVAGAPREEFDGPYLILRCESSGTAEGNVHGTWNTNSILTSTALPFRPAMRTPRPIVPGPETAVVVGPEKPGIHTDEHGRVKVHFHWDRRKAPDDPTSSCWIRVQQSWAGPGYGTFFLPRVGMEVIVTFLGGNPDCPVVTGCLYNGRNRASVDLPGDKTQSVIRTDSSGGRAGHNELRFEDAAGHELITLHAQRNLHQVIRGYHGTRVGGEQSTKVGGNCKIEGSKEILIKAVTSITLVCGDSQILIEPKSITLSSGGAKIVLDGAANKVAVEGATAVNIKGGAGTVDADSAGVNIQGPLVKLN